MTPIPGLTYEYDQWNVHYHVLFDGDYIPQSVCSDLFSRVTGGESRYTYIKAPGYGQPIAAQKAALRYVLKYLGKVEGINNDPSVLAEFYTATKKVRFYNIGLNKAEKTALPAPQSLTCRNCGSQRWRTLFDPVDIAAAHALTDGLGEEQRGATLAPRDKERRVLPAAFTISVPDELGDVAEEITVIDVDETILATCEERGLATYDDLRRAAPCSDAYFDDRLDRLLKRGDLYEPRSGQYGVLR